MKSVLYSIDHVWDLSNWLIHGQKLNKKVFTCIFLFALAKLHKIPFILGLKKLTGGLKIPTVAKGVRNLRKVLLLQLNFWIGLPHFCLPKELDQMLRDEL